MSGPDPREAPAPPDATSSEPFNELRSILTVFTPDFQIFPGTANARPVPAAKPFQFVLNPMTIAE